MKYDGTPCSFCTFSYSCSLLLYGLSSCTKNNEYTYKSIFFINKSFYKSPKIQDTFLDPHGIFSQ